MTPERTLKSSAIAEPAPVTNLARNPKAKVGEKIPAGNKHGMRSSGSGLWHSLIDFFSSLRLTVVCLGLGLVLVFAGTLAQVDIGLYNAQNAFFRSFFIYWSPKGSAFRIPIFPGGYFLGSVLLMNLITAHVTRFKLTKKKAGIWMIHVGLILLLLGQLLTDMLARESALQLFVGESRNFSEDFRAIELALIDKSDPKSDLVYSVPEKIFSRQNTINDPRLPFTIRVKKFWINAFVLKPDSKAPMAVHTGATAGEEKDNLVIPQPGVNETDKRNTPAGVIEIEDHGKSLGSFFVRSDSRTGENFTVRGKQYEIALRFIRYYYPFSLTLLKATHEQYRGTGIPKNFASRVRIDNPQHNEARETDIYMNNPLRYSGHTFYQYQMLAGEVAEQAGAPSSSTFQVVRNPSWVTPYASCVLISAGLLVQFLSHLFGFLKRRPA